MFKVYIHNVVFGMMGSFVAASEHKLLNTFPFPVEGTDEEVHRLEWVTGNETLGVQMQ